MHKLGSALDIGHFRSKTPQLFIIWVLANTTLSVMPYSKNVAVSLKLTDSGMVVHFVSYFLGSALFYWAFIKGPQITQIDADEGEIGNGKEERGKRLRKFEKRKWELGKSKKSIGKRKGEK